MTHSYACWAPRNGGDCAKDCDCKCHGTHLCTNPDCGAYLDKDHVPSWQEEEFALAVSEGVMF